MFIEGIMPDQDDGIYLNTRYILCIRKLDDSVCIETEEATYLFHEVRVGNFTYKAGDVDNLVTRINQG